MESIEQRVLELTMVVQQLQKELDALKESGHGQSGMCTDANNGKHLHPHCNDEELFHILSTGKDMEGIGAPLTHRERQILDCIANGTTNKRIGYVLGISTQTVKNHVSIILRKLNAHDRAHAVALAMCNGWLFTERKHESMVAVS